MNDMRYALVWYDGDIWTGTKAELGRELLENRGEEVRVVPYEGEDEETAEVLSTETRGDDGEWSQYDEIENQGSPEDNQEEAYRNYFYYEVEACKDENIKLYELETEEQEEAFDMDYDDLLDCITAREAREAGLDLDDEAQVRAWYFENKAA